MPRYLLSTPALIYVCAARVLSEMLSTCLMRLTQGESGNERSVLVCVGERESKYVWERVAGVRMFVCVAQETSAKRKLPRKKPSSVFICLFRM